MRGLVLTQALKTSLTVTDHNLYTVFPYKDSLLMLSGAKEARAYYKDHYIDLLTGESHEFAVEGWLALLNFPVAMHPIEKRVVHLFYELGFLFENLSEEIMSTDLLALDIEYSEREEFQVNPDHKKIILSLKSAPHYHDYEKQFQKGYKELTEGNCYQFNLTGEYTYDFEDDVEAEDFISALWKDPKKRGAFASATYVEHFEQVFLSNSPECLFRYEGGMLSTMPIKGTMKRNTDDPKEIKNLWKELVLDKKSEGELFMIADLLRNDLCRIDLPRAIVTRKKAMLLVPGLIHQYSEIKVPLSQHVTLKNILEKIFPGGSITGAPKKRVMQILKKLESRTRGFYCGSTLLFSKGQIEASINIRSSVVDFKKRSLSYQAGGGITLLSQPQHEFLEMTYKHDSYIDTLTL